MVPDTSLIGVTFRTPNFNILDMHFFIETYPVYTSSQPYTENIIEYLFSVKTMILKSLEDSTVLFSI